MRILVEPSAHHHLNAGDAAMLKVAVERLQGLWPEASVGVITADADRLAVLCPGAVPVPAAGREVWLDKPSLPVTLHLALPPAAAKGLRSWERRLRISAPPIARAAVRGATRLRGESNGPLDEFLDWTRADLLVVSGAGLLADPFAIRAVSVLELLGSAIRRGMPTAMMGQGIGRFRSPELLEWATSVLPRVDLLGLREDRVGRPVLRSLGVADHRIVTTGDDAVEFAFRARRDDPAGTDIGVCLRKARYSGLTERHCQLLRSTLTEVARATGTALAPVPISQVANERDDVVLREIVGAGHEPGPVEGPQAAVERIQRCGVVVTGSYHAAVLALAQGIPAIGLAAADYYFEKFEGLNDQFAGHCPVVSLVGAEFGASLATAIIRALEQRDAVRPALLEAARRQTTAGRAAYQMLAQVPRDGPAGAPAAGTHPSGAGRGRARVAALRHRLPAAIDPTRRYNLQLQGDPRWDERAEAAARLLAGLVERADPRPSSLEVGDFGCGNQRLNGALRRALHVPVSYHGYDITPQSSTVTRIDLQRELPGRQFDVVFCLGLLEYLNDVRTFAWRLHDVCRLLLVTYVPLDSAAPLTPAERSRRGWRHQFRRDEIEGVFAAAGFCPLRSEPLEAGRTWLWLLEAE